mgnify:CR=1 FL=1
MLNFTMGPVQSNECVRAIGAEQVPYFRTPEFSSILLESEHLIKNFANAESDARAVFLTASGTAAMEAVVMNLLTKDDRALVVNGGSFGQRFADLCRIHEVTFDEIKLNAGEALTAEHLAAYQDLDYTAFLVNLHETSTGVYYDISLISEFCKRNEIFLLVDAISSFLADPFDMRDLGVGAMISSSQKVLACPPGVSILLLSVAALKRVAQNHVQSLYFDLQDALKNGERGQTPFTPAVGILLQIHARLREIDKAGGAGSEIRKVSALATDFRQRITALPLEIASKSLSNTMTPLHPLNVPADQVFQVLKDEYGIWVCPNGGDLKERIFRVGHIGTLTQDDNSKLIEALHDMRSRALL